MPGGAWDSTVGEAAAHLRATGEQVVVTMRAGRPAGLVSAEQVLEALRSWNSDAPVRSLVDYVAVPVPPGADAHSVLETFNRAAWDWLRSPGRA